MSNPDTFPPSPPLRPEVNFNDSAQSTSVASSHSTAANPYCNAAASSVEAHQQRQQIPPSRSSNSIRTQIPQSQPPYQALPYSPSLASSSSYSFLSSPHANARTQNLFYQRSLPNTFSPSEISTTISPVIPGSHDSSPVDHSNPWQHHHYISPSSAAAFSSQSQDRYVCQTCNKAFSRPSSLRIHGHSHTGEKPFTCSHTGCGKAFSVRSNMKRHERGCHGGESPGST